MALLPDIIAIIIATFSVIGFTVVISIPTISSTFFQLLMQSPGSRTKVLRVEPAFRIIERFSKPQWVVYYSLLSLGFTIPGLLILFDAISGVDLLAPSLAILVVGLSAFIVGTSYVVLRSTIFLPKEVKQLLPYLEEDGVTPKHRRKRCPACRKLIPGDSDYCPKCGKKCS